MENNERKNIKNILKKKILFFKIILYNSCEHLYDFF